MENYDICIIAAPEDAAVAEILADSIRSYRLPRNIQLNDPTLDYRRVFVESTGSDFDDSVKLLLDHARYLVVICSPDAKASNAIKARLTYYRHFCRNENIVAVIVRGEPADAFPESFIERKVVRRILPDMRVVEREETIEPVAADLRGDTPARRKQLLRYETVRITASVLGLHPDALEQRQHRRRQAAILAAASAVCSVLLVISVLFLRLGLIARNEGRIAEAQTEKSVEVAQRLTQELPELFADNPEALSYIQEAIDHAQSALEGIAKGAQEGS